MMKKLLTMLMVLALLLPCCTWAEEAEAPAVPQTPVYEPLPLGGPAPYTAVPGALSEDGRSYDDGTLKVWIEEDIVDDVTVYYVYVTIQDPSQLRTAPADVKPFRR